MWECGQREGQTDRLWQPVTCVTYHLWHLKCCNAITCPQKHNKSRSNIPTVSPSVWNRPPGFDSTLIYNVGEPPGCNLTSPWHQITRSMSWGCTVCCFIHHRSCVYWTQQAEPVCVTGFSVLCSDKILPLSHIHSKSVSGISLQFVNIAKLSFHGANAQQYFSKQRTIKKNKKKTTLVYLLPEIWHSQFKR